MKKSTFKFSTLILFLFLGTTLMAQMPEAISIDPADASVYDQLTLTLDASKTCPDSALFNADYVWMHSGVNIDGAGWQNVVDFNDTAVNGRYPRLVKVGGFPGPITVEPEGATAWEEITLTLDTRLTCPMGSLFDAESVYMHSGLTIDDAPWSNVIDFDGMGADGTEPILTDNGDSTWSITFTPSAFYGLTPGTDPTQICCVFNNGSWDAEGKYFAADGSCSDFFYPLGEVEDSYMWQITYTPADFYGLEPDLAIEELNMVFNAGDWSLGEGKDFNEDGDCTDFLVPMHVSAVGDYYSLSFTMYPNPADQVLYLDNLEDVSLVEVYNIMGERVNTFDQVNTKISINTSNLQSGVYFVNVHANGIVQTAKFLKK